MRIVVLPSNPSTFRTVQASMQCHVQYIPAIIVFRSVALVCIDGGKADRIMTANGRAGCSIGIIASHDTTLLR
jgi:hypothetical protein